MTRIASLPTDRCTGYRPPYSDVVHEQCRRFERNEKLVRVKSCEAKVCLLEGRIVAAVLN
jgi:hypothetical protein